MVAIPPRFLFFFHLIPAASNKLNLRELNSRKKEEIWRRNWRMSRLSSLFSLAIAGFHGPIHSFILSFSFRQNWCRSFAAASNSFILSANKFNKEEKSKLARWKKREKLALKSDIGIYLIWITPGEWIEWAQTEKKLIQQRKRKHGLAAVFLSTSFFPR